jgi:hypothetical protein
VPWKRAYAEWAFRITSSLRRRARTSRKRVRRWGKRLGGALQAS